jgi:acetoin utilization deacetylase AcuC-like enzyme
LRRIHTAAHVAAIRATAGRAVSLDPDTSTSPESYEVACLAAGAAIGAVDQVLAAPAGNPAFAFVRPPGHHAEAERAMGFCLFNSIAVAAAHARAQGIARVAIVDIDVHHGNGTQAAFYDDPSVLYVSSHQFPYYPGTGAATEIGRGAGAGFTVNLPLEAGAGDADVDEAYRRVAVPVLDQFAPQLVLVSAGFDAHEADPLGALRMTAPGFAVLARLLAGVAARHAGGRLALVTEGGYDLDALDASLHAVLEACADGTDREAPTVAGDRSRGRRAADAARAALTAHWRF